MFLLMLVLTLTGPDRVVTQMGYSSLASTVRVGEYFSNTYTARGAMRLGFVYFVGEPISVRLVIANEGPDEEDLRFTSATTDNMFSVELLHDGRPASQGLVFADGELHQLDGQVSPVVTGEPTRLQAREEIYWRAVFDGPLAPGAYRLRIVANAEGRTRRPVFPNASTHEFEVRPRVPAAEVEIIRREAWRHLVAGSSQDLQDAEAAIDRLLKQHPNSYEAFLLRGKIAEARGDQKGATTSYRRAADILRGEQDQLLMKFKSQMERQQMLRSVDELAARKP